MAIKTFGTLSWDSNYKKPCKALVIPDPGLCIALLYYNVSRVGNVIRIAFIHVTSVLINKVMVLFIELDMNMGNVMDVTYFKRLKRKFN